MKPIRRIVLRNPIPSKELIRSGYSKIEQTRFLILEPVSLISDRIGHPRCHKESSNFTRAQVTVVKKVVDIKGLFLITYVILAPGYRRNAMF